MHYARGEVTRAEVAALAEALGVSGTPTLRDGAWKVTPDKDGSGPSLQVNKQAPGTWTYTGHGTGGTDDCPKGKPCSATSAAPDGELGDAVGERAAKDAAAPVLKALGQDDAKLDARQLMGAVRVVNADPKVDGLPTYGWSTGIQVGSDGEVVGGSGRLKAPVKGAEYPVIGAAETLDRLNSKGGSGGGGIAGCATPVPHADDSTKTEGGGTKQAPCTPSPTPPKPQPIAVSGATFGLAAHFVDGRQALVPSWLFEVKPEGAEESFTVTHPAVAPKYLTSPTRAGTPEPTGKPERGDGAARIESYRADGTSLTVNFWGGACSEYSASASEDGDRVRVTVSEQQQEGKVCVMMAKEMRDTVTLDEPLGDREVVDTAGGKVRPE
ncbi:Large membrane protein OS=Streptomyces alboniger OX=132473 GN=CP975_09495 PE=4 SV=1 [Streptomyces alboniger]